MKTLTRKSLRWKGWSLAGAVGIVALTGSAVAETNPQFVCGNTSDDSSMVDTRAPGASMDGIPVLDQDGEALCYSYAGSVMVSAYLRSHATGMTREEKDKLIVSPLITGFTSADGQYAMASCGMNAPCLIANFLKGHGACSIRNTVTQIGGEYHPIDAPYLSLDSCGHPGTPRALADRSQPNWAQAGSSTDLVNEIRRMRSDSHQILEELFSNIESARRSFSNIDQPGADGQPPGNLAAWRTERDRIVQNLITHYGALYDNNAGVTRDKLRAIADYYFFSSSDNRAAVASFAPACFNVTRQTASGGQTTFDWQYTGSFQLGQPIAPGRPAVPTFSSCRSEDNLSYGNCNQAVTNHSPREFLGLLNQHFDRPNPQPVSIAYCWTFLLDGAGARSEWGEPRDEHGWMSDFRGCRRNGKGEVDHKSVLIGRRWNQTTHRCEFLLRNSWGNDCGSYYSPPSGVNYPDLHASCVQELHDHGAADIWVPSDVLVNNMHGYMALDE